MPAPLQKKFSENFVATWKDCPASLLSGNSPLELQEIAKSLIKKILGASMDATHLIHMGPEKNAIRIDTIRELIRRISLKPTHGNRVVVWIEETDTLTEGAANALLKTLEEPPDTVCFLLTTTMPEKILPTIRSRCRKVNIPLSIENLREDYAHLKQTWEKELPALLTSSPSFSKISKQAEALVGDAETLPFFLNFLEGVWHDLTLLQGKIEDRFLLMPPLKSLLQPSAQTRPLRKTFEELNLILETRRALEGNVNKTLALERLLMKLTASQ